MTGEIACLRLDAAWGSPRLSYSTGRLVFVSGGSGLPGCPAAGGDDGIPSQAGGDDRVQLA
jgi:hypothetical protein